MFCKNCGTDVGESKFCPNCGTSIVEFVNQKRFCSNCGAEAGDSNFCPDCGASINGTVAYQSNAAVRNVVLVKEKKPLKRSLSFIFFGVLGGLLIAMTFINSFCECRSWSKFAGETFQDESSIESFWHLSTDYVSSVWGIVAIALFALPMIFSFINFFARTRALAIINTVATSMSLVYLLVASLLLADNHFNYFVGYLYTENLHSLNSFGILFYLMLAVNLVMCVISIFDTIDKPLIKI